LRIPKKLPHSTQVSLTADDSSPPVTPSPSILLYRRGSRLLSSPLLLNLSSPNPQKMSNTSSILLLNNLQNLAGQLSDVLENLSPISQHDELEAKFREERAVLEAKYEKLYQPIYAKDKTAQGYFRNTVPSSFCLGKINKIQHCFMCSISERGVLSFWLTALQNNDVTSHVVTMHDEEALRTEIDWYPAKCVTQKILKKKPKKGSTNPAPFTKVEDCESFFSFFNPPEMKISTRTDNASCSLMHAEELQNLMEQDYEIGFTIRDKIIPHAVHGLLVRLWKDMSLTWSSVVWLKKR
ncbi:unnamed protein product, partial [Brassica oleracea]